MPGKILYGFFSALSFLTLIPVSRKLSGGYENLGKATGWFPFVGLLAGFAAAFLDICLFEFLPPLLGASLCMLFFIFISKGLHLDGLADTADGFFSSRPRERILEIMRDSRIGTMGAAAISAVMIIKTSSIFSLGPDFRLPAIIMAPVAGRCAITATMAFFGYARKEGGLASVFTEDISWKHGLWAFFALVVTGFLAGGLRGAIVALIASVFIISFAYYSEIKIGGFTGDTLGAGCELAEMAVFISFAAFS